MATNLRNGSPSIEVMTAGNALNLTLFMLKPGEEKIVANRLHEELSKVAS